MFTDSFRLPLILAAISLVFYRYYRPIILGSEGFNYSYSQVPSYFLTFFTFFLCRSSIIFIIYFLFYSSILGKYFSFTVSSINFLTFYLFSLAIFFSSSLWSTYLSISKLDLYFDCNCSYCNQSILYSYSCLSLLIFYFQLLISQYFRSCSQSTLLSIDSNIECLQLIILLLFYFQFFQYLWQKLCYSFLKSGGCWAKLLEINLQSLFLCYLSALYFYLFYSFSFIFLSNSSFLSFTNFSLSSLSSCYLFNFPSSYFFFCSSMTLDLSSFSFFCFLKNYSYYFTFYSLISKALNLDSEVWL